ncbi:MAG: CinA family protein [Pseudolabrys sp.]
MTDAAIIDDKMRAAAAKFLELCRARGFMIATAESCTGGLVSATLTEIAGSSAVVDCAFVTYSNGAKEAMLGVDKTLLQTHGAVSAQTAEAMARGALEKSGADLVVSITGVAGPGASKDKPAGLVYFAAAARNGKTLKSEQRFGAIGRGPIRQKSVLQALSMLSELARSSGGEQVEQF